MIKGSGSLLSNNDESGDPIPFMTTEEILKELQRFGFYITYNLKSNLPNDVLDFLSTVDNLGFDKITKIGLQQRFVNGCSRYVETTIVFKSQYNSDLLTYGCKVSKDDFNKKLADNTIMNVSNEPGLVWDWVTSMLGIEDVLNDNVDTVDPYETDTNMIDDAPLSIPADMLDSNGLPIPQPVDGGMI